MELTLVDRAKAMGVRQFLFSYTDLHGCARAKLVSVNAWHSAQDRSIRFSAFAGYLDLPRAGGTLYGTPDESCLIQLPWNKEVGWVPLDLSYEGQQLEKAPRNCLKRMVARAAQQRLVIKTGIECEFFLLDPDKVEVADSRDSRSRSCYDQEALMRQYHVLTELTDYMEELGWRPYQADHEEGYGQYEINWQYADALTSADRHAFFKFMARTVAEKHNLRITFMPKPFADRVGNGCHVHISAWADDQNVFLGDTGAEEFSPLGYAFLGGVMCHSVDMCAITNPTVNSYKRLLPPLSLGTDVWGRNSVTFSGDNRTHMFRIPSSGRFEFRLPDGAANPYLMPAAVVAAGLDGIEHGTQPGRLAAYDMSSSQSTKAAPLLPEDLSQAIHNLENSALMNDSLGKETIASYAKARRNEFKSYARYVTDWERSTTLDC